ncbi:DNA polymerase IV [Patescibacteria group bacterium]|nr:MAG: DNA polymerase IV [Patescibacteria group bacterium]
MLYVVRHAQVLRRLHGIRPVPQGTRTRTVDEPPAAARVAPALQAGRAADAVAPGLGRGIVERITIHADPPSPKASAGRHAWQRIIMHVDMNSYFASVEQQFNPALRGKPIGVTGKRTERSVVAAASREAKLLGVKTAMSTWEARRICPSLIIVHGDPRKYAMITERFNAIFNDHADKVERFSVDESFLDVTIAARDYLGAIAIAQSIKHHLRRECGECITASVGIAPNKLLAKAASERMKPDGLTVVKPGEEIAFLDTLALEDVCGIGPRIARRLGQLGITTIPQLRAAPLGLLVNEFKSYGCWLLNAARGIDPDDVVHDPSTGSGRRAVAPKSVGHSYTLPRDACAPTTIRRYLLGLCDKVAWRLRRDGYAARSVSAYVRFGDFSGAGRQRRFDEPVNDGLSLYRIAWSLLTDPLMLPLSKGEIARPVRLIGLSAGRLAPVSGQPSLFAADRKRERVNAALDRAQRRFGSGAWTRASLLNTSILERTSGFAYDHEL